MSRDVADPKALVAMVDCPRLRCVIGSSLCNWHELIILIMSRWLWVLIMFEHNLNPKHHKKVIEKSSNNPPKSSKHPPKYSKSYKQNPSKHPQMFP